MIARPMIVATFALLLVMCGLPAHAAPLKGPCEEDFERCCPDVKPGDRRMADCLKRHEETLSDQCKDYLNKWSKQLDDLEGACAGDIHDYCRDVKASIPRVVGCLKDNINQVSHPCHALLKGGEKG